MALPYLGSVYLGDTYAGAQNPNGRPGQVSVSATPATSTSIDLALLSTNPGATNTQWQVDPVGGDFSAPEYNDDSTVDITSTTATGLAFGDKIVRVRQSLDSGTTWGAWSNTLITGTLGAFLGASFTQTANVDFQQQLAGFDEVDEPFDTDLSSYTAYTQDALAAASVAGGVLTVQNTSGAAASNLYNTGSDVTVPQHWCEIEVHGGSSTPEGAGDFIGVGLYKDQDNYVCVDYKQPAGWLQVHARIAGVDHYPGTVGQLSIGVLTGTYKIGFALIGNKLETWYDSGSGWTYKWSTSISSYINLQTASLTGWKPGFSVRTPGNSTWVLDNFKDGSFGGVGLRDIAVVADETGAPVVESGAVRFLASTASGGGGGYQGGFKLDLTTYEITQVAVYLFDRSSTKQLDLASQLIAVSDGSFRFFVSGWGTAFGDVRIWTGSYAAGSGLLDGVHLVGSLTALSLPGSGSARYDPSAILIGSTWWLAYTTTTNFLSNGLHIALATSTDLSTWTLVGQDLTVNAEGSRLLLANATTYLLSSTTSAYRVYSDAVAFEKYLDADHSFASAKWYGQPHPMVFDYAGEYYLLTWDGTTYGGADYTWGNLRVLEATSASVAPPANTQPDAPTLSHSALTATTVTLTGSAFSDPDPGDGHLESQWQVATDAGFASLVEDVTSGVDFVSHDVTGLAPSTAYYARLRYRDDSAAGVNEWSDWSASDAFSTPAVVETRYTQIVREYGVEEPAIIDVTQAPRDMVVDLTTTEEVTQAPRDMVVDLDSTEEVTQAPREYITPWGIPPDQPGLIADAHCGLPTLSRVGDYASPDNVPWRDSRWRLYDALHTLVYDTDWITERDAHTYDPQYLVAPATDPLPDGDYTATLTDRDARLAESAESDPFPITVAANSPPTAAPITSPTPYEAVVGPTLDLDATHATDPDGDALQYRWRWRQGCGGEWREVHPGVLLDDPAYTWDISALAPADDYELELRAWDGCDWGPPSYQYFSLTQPPCLPEQPNPTFVRRLEVWSELEGAGGERLAVIYDFSRCQVYRSLEDQHYIHVELPRDRDYWAYVDQGRVLRTVYEDFTYEEWRKDLVEDERAEDAGLRAVIRARHPRFDLGNGRVGFTNVDGSRSLDFTLSQQTPDVHVDVILASAKRIFAAGTIEPTDPVDLAYHWSTPLAALLDLAGATEMEVDVQRACQQYLVSLVEQIGSAADVVHLRYRRNTRSLRRTLDWTRLATRVWPKGADVDGLAFSIADALWEITAIDTAENRVTLADDPFAFTGQMDGYWVRRYGDAVLIRVVTTEVPNEMILETVEDLSVGDFVQFRDPCTMGDVLYLENPAAKALWGLWDPPDAVERTDLPPVDNFGPNPFFTVWDTGLPVSWGAVGAAVISQNTESLYTQKGGSSAHVVAAADGEGIESGWFSVVPTERRPYFTLQESIFVVAGAVRLELDADLDGAGGDVVTFPDASETAYTTKRNIWVEDVALAGIDLYSIGAKRVRIRVVAQGASGAEWYQDAVQLTQTAGGVDAWYDRFASNELWHAGNLHLAGYSNPLATYDHRPVDRFRTDPAAFPFDKFVLGGNAIVHDADLGVDVLTRLIEIQQELTPDRVAESTVRLSNQPPALTRLLQAESQRSGVRLVAGPTTGVGTGSVGTTPPPPGATAGGAISNLAATFSGGGSGIGVDISWSHNDAVQTDGSARFTIDITRTVRELTPFGPGSGPDSLAIGRNPKLEAGGSDAQPNIGGYQDTAWGEGSAAAGDPLLMIVYTLALKDSGTVVSTKSVSIWGYFMPA